MTPYPQLVPLEELDLGREPPGFLELVDRELSTAGTPSDGFDDVLTESILLLEGFEQVLDAVDNDLGDVGVIANLIDPSSLDQDFLAFQADLVTGQGVLDDAALLLGPAPSPRPVAPTPTPPAEPPPTPSGELGPRLTVTNLANLLFGPGLFIETPARPGQF